MQITWHVQFHFRCKISVDFSWYFLLLKRLGNANIILKNLNPTSKLLSSYEYFDFLANCLHFRGAGDRILSYHRELWELITEKTSCSAQVVVAVIKKLVHTLSCVNTELRMRVEVWKALKKLELVTHLSCSPNFPRAPITRYSHARHELILYWNSSPIDVCWESARNPCGSRPEREQ